METTTAGTASPPDAHQRSALVHRLETSDTFRDYQRAFQSLTGLPLVLRAPGSFQVALSGARQGNPFCALLTTHNKTCAAALQFQDRLELAARTGAATLESFAHLYESAVPLLVGAQLVGYLHTGQVLHQVPTAADARKAAREIHRLDAAIPAAELAAAYLQTRIMPRAQYDAALRVLGFFADQLAALSNQLMVQQNLAEAPAITRARQFIAANFAEEISLQQVARTVGMSTFYFCKNFRRSTGLTFTDYLARSRVEVVKELLLNPNKRVSEAAFEAGFQSLSQFNRVFHRIAGAAPSAYRAQLHAPACAA
ncbi:MAG: Transcriptional regulator, AraC family [Lacunisphaera sp.]|nr:Transcriptional regulator, AraC family [Acidobacteriota bacterium]MDB6165988.1 Transcriptional regulator, AraC family [Lacunisphaera sp.]